MAIFTAKAELIDREAEESFTQRIINYLSEHFSEPLTISKISEDLNIPVPTISKNFNSSMGMTIPSFINWLRASKTADLLASTDKGILEISEEVGFVSLCNLNRSFQAFYEMTPTKYRKLYIEKGDKAFSDKR
ncbi:MAG: AraC family transcriptional regulator [Acutalibacteraceae bacterium]|nr:AraC family transcriptional regulator [Acutalibacteraceae bacterium]